MRGANAAARWAAGLRLHRWLGGPWAFPPLLLPSPATPGRPPVWRRPWRTPSSSTRFVWRTAPRPRSPRAPPCRPASTRTPPTTPPATPATSPARPAGGGPPCLGARRNAPRPRISLNPPPSPPHPQVLGHLHQPARQGRQGRRRRSRSRRPGMAPRRLRRAVRSAGMGQRLLLRVGGGPPAGGAPGWCVALGQSCRCRRCGASSRRCASGRAPTTGCLPGAPPARPAEKGPTLDLFRLTEAMQERGLRAPMLFRFLPIVGHRIEKLNVGAALGAGRAALQLPAGRQRGVTGAAAGAGRQRGSTPHECWKGVGCSRCSRQQAPDSPRPSPRCRRCPQAAFSAAIERFEYAGCYRGVFPVKANHDKALIEAVLRYGAPPRWRRAARLGCPAWGRAAAACRSGRRRLASVVQRLPAPSCAAQPLPSSHTLSASRLPPPPHTHQAPPTALAWRWAARRSW